MKKFLSILLTLTFLLTMAVPAMAEDAVEDTVVLNEVEHSIEAYRAVGNKTVIISGAIDKTKPESVEKHAKWRAWYITTSGASQPANQMSTKMTEKRFGVQPLPLPEVPNGKLLGRYIFQFGGSDTYGTQNKVLKLPGEDWDFANMTADDPAFADLLKNPDKHTAGDAPILYELSSIGKEYRNFVDLTSYAQECIDNGQKVMYVVFGCWNSTRNLRINIEWTSSGYPTADLYQAYYYDFDSLYPFELVDETIHGGEQAFPADSELSWEFTNDIMDFTATVNGKDAKIVIDGTKASIDEPLDEITDYELTITARDQWDEIITKTYKFSTGFKTGATAPEVPVLDAYDIKTVVDMMGDEYALTELSFYLLTQFEDANEALMVRDAEGNDAGVEFIYYDYNNKYDITEPAFLANDTAYEFVLKAGVPDVYGNALEEDLVLAKFYGGETPEEVAFTDDALEIGYDYANSKITLDFANSAYTNRPVEIVLFKDGAFFYNETFTTSKKGSLETIEIPLSMGNYDLTVRPKNAPDCYGESFVFYSYADVENLWKMVAINVDTAENNDEASNAIVDNWEHIENCFGFTSDYFNDVSDFKAFAKKLIAIRKGVTAEVTTANINTMAQLVEDAAYFVALESSTDIEKTKSFIAVRNDDLMEANKDVYDLWKKALDSKYANATIQAFIDAQKDIKSIKNIATTMEEALKVYKGGVLLDRIAAPANSSEVEQILSVEENLELLGVASFADRYNNLKNKDALIDEISGNEYADADAFADAFDKALVKAEENDDVNEEEDDPKPPKKPSSNGSGKGSSSTTGTQFMSSVPSSQTPFVTFTDIENVAWAKDHIIKLYNIGVINGKTSTEFAPNDNITREEFTKLIVSMTKLTADSNASVFTDVPSDSWFALYVNAAVSNGVVNGIGGGLFGTGYNATRQDIAVMIVNALKAKGVQITSESANFGDNALIADYAMEAVAFLNANGVITGDESANFNPRANATRAEVAVMLSRVNDIFMKEVK